MNAEEEVQPELPTTLLLVIGVVLTVLVAIFLAFSDELQSRLPAPIRPTAVVQGDIEVTPIPPTSTPPPPATPDPAASLTATPTATSVSIIAEAGCDNAPESWGPVVVGPDDTLFSLSIQSGATVGEIIHANCLEGKALITGMIIYLPAVPPTRAPCRVPQGWVDYTVRPGDTLSSLARRHRTTVYAIMQANCLTTTKIVAGRRLYLPPLPATVPPPPTIVLPSRTPTVTPTPIATVTGQPSVTPSPTATPPPEATPTVTGTPPASETPQPSVSSTPPTSPTTTASPTAGPSETAVPSATPTVPPTNTPQPTEPPTDTPPPTATESPPTPETPEF